MSKTREVRPGSWKYPRNANTLANLVHQRAVLVVVCRRCKHSGVVYAFNLIPRFGANCPAIHVRRYLRCSACRCTSPNIHEASR
jgi:hypothetical protein